MMKEVYRDLLIMKLIPAIMEKWPISDRNSRKIFIQQDGAKNHIREDDKLFNDALEENGVDAELYTQSENSPDVNLLDLGFFRAIQSVNDAALRNEEESIKAVSEAYDKYPKEKFNQTWLTLQCCFNQIITHHGDNDYHIDHIVKEKLEQNGNLPDVMDVVDNAEYLLDPNSMDEDDNVEKPLFTIGLISFCADQFSSLCSPMQRLLLYMYLSHLMSTFTNNL